MRNYIVKEMNSIHKKKIAWDFDGTIVNSADKVIYLANKEYGTKVKFGTYYKWNFTDLFPQMTDPLKYFRSPEFFKNLHYIDKDMKTVLYTLYRLGFEQKIISIGCTENINRKKEWLSENLPFLNLKESHFLIQDKMGKGSVDLSDSILIDDHIDNITSSNAWHKICFGKVTDYNKDAEDLGYFRTSNSLILLRHILGLIKENQIDE